MFLTKNSNFMFSFVKKKLCKDFKNSNTEKAVIETVVNTVLINTIIK